MEILDDFKFDKRKRGGFWHKYMDGKIYQLRQGLDFEVKIESARHNFYQACKRRGLYPLTSVEGELLTVQALKENPKGE